MFLHYIYIQERKYDINVCLVMSYLQFDEMRVQLIIHTAVLPSSLAITSSSTTGRLTKPGTEPIKTPSIVCTLYCFCFHFNYSLLLNKLMN